MTSTERLLTVLRGELPDRVPISTYELVGWKEEAWENNEPSYARLMELIRAKTDCLYMCSVQAPNARQSEIETSSEEFDEDGYRVRRTSTRAGDRTLTETSRWRDDVKTVWRTERPCKSIEDMEAWLELPWAPGQVDFSALETAWDRLGETRGLPLVSMPDPIGVVAELFELETFLVLAMTETDRIAAAMDEVHERILAELRRKLAGPVRNAVFRICGPEYATPPYLPPELFARFVTPYVATYAHMIHLAGGFARIHSHGKIGKVVDELAKMGPAAIDPVEPPPDGDITIAELKQRIGDRITLMGGIELKHLEGADEAFVEQLTRDTIAAGKPGGRFVLMPTAAPINIPLSPQTEANYRRMIETAVEAGRY